MTRDTEALDAAWQIVDALGEPAAREFLRVLKMPDDERLDLIVHLYQRDDTHGIAEMPTDVEEDPDDIVRLRLIGGLGAVLGIPSRRAPLGARRGRSPEPPEPSPPQTGPFACALACLTGPSLASPLRDPEGVRR